jgi:hypothetical protein
MRPETMGRTTPLSPNLIAYVRTVRELHHLFLNGKEESEEADAIRDASDIPWKAMTDEERERAGGLSEDLYSISDPPPDLQPMTLEARNQFTQAVEASLARDWDQALTLLRGLKPFVAPEILSSYRGSIWLAMGDPATAAVFLDHAARYLPPARRA